MDFIAHRGESIDAPENTMAAFELAWQRDCDGVECDVWMTKDNVLVCHHDNTLKRIAGCDVYTTQMTYTEMLTKDFGAWKGDQWQNERIPTLKQLLDSTPPGKKLFIEIKDTERAIPAFIDCIKESSIQHDQISMISFNETVVSTCKQQLPGIKSILLTGIEERHQCRFNDSDAEFIFEPSATQLIDKLQLLNADGVDVFANKSLTKEYVNAVKAAGFEFHVWTIDEVEYGRQFKALGVDSITSNCAALLAEKLNDQKK